MPEGRVSIEVVDLAGDTWDQHVASWSDATIFHTQAWARVLQDAYGFTPVYLAAHCAGEWIGGLPVMEVKSPWTGRRGVSLPFTDYCSPLGEKAIHPQLFEAALNQGAQRRWKYCELRGSCGSLRAQPSVSYYGHTLDLTIGPDALWDGLNPAVRRAIRKAEQSNLELEFTQSAEGVREFHHLLCRTRKRQGVPPQPMRFFEQIRRHLLEKNCGWILLARHEGCAVAGALFFQFGPTGMFKFGASDERFQQLRANNLIMWQAIEWHTHRGYNTLDFGRTSMSHEGLRHFKRNWGTQEQVINYARYDCHRGEFIKVPDLAAGWHTKLLQCVPIPLTRLFGALAYKHVA